MISHTRQGVLFVTGIGFCGRSASCDITHKTGGTSFYGYWVLRLVISLTRQGLRFVMCIGFCVLLYHLRDRGYDLLRALGSASCDNTHETGGTICYGHWVLRLVISHTRQGVRFLRGIGFCLLRYHTRDRGYDVLQALGSASSDITHETRGSICCGHWLLRLVISHTRQGVRCATGLGFCVL